MSHWTPFYWGDYLRDTSHLDLRQHGAYTRLLGWYYSNAQPLPANAEQLHRICSAVAPAEQAAVDYVLSEFFVLQDGKYHNKRADAELAKREQISESRRRAALARHGSAGDSVSPESPGNNAPEHESTHANAEQVQSKCIANAGAKDHANRLQKGYTHNHNHNHNHKPQKKGSPESYPPEFEKLWQERPRRAGNDPKPKAFMAWRARIAEGKATEEQALAAVQAYRAFCEKTGKVGTEQVMQLASFFGPQVEGYAQDWAPPKPNSEARGKRSEQDWIRYGEQVGKPARPGETMAGYIRRLQEHHRNENSN